MADILPKISIITPVFNQKDFIEDCITSILNQNYPNLEYIIVDGGSTDGTLNIISRYAGGISYTVSEPDKGMYDALQKGFSKSTGEIMCWLNADDKLHPQSLFTIAEIFKKNNAINWLQGLPTVIDKDNRVVFSRPARNDKFEFLLKKYHDGIFIQQESTCWRRKLWEKAGGMISREFKFAGDFELWMRFYQYDDLYSTHALIGAFRYRGKGQLSKDHYDEYLNECDQIIDKAASNLSPEDRSRLKRLKKHERMVNHFPRLTKWILGSAGVFTKNKKTDVYFDFNEYKFKV
jgi:glycosyltransferase involved in cell wall biosynthesis